MRLIQFRLGPNKNFFLGLLQPILDGLKFFLKKNLNLNKNFFFFFFPSFLSFLLSNLIFTFFFFSSLKFKVLFFFIIIGINSYTFLITGWISYSKFSYIGGVRASSQTLSYEIVLSLVIFILIFFFINKKLNYFNFFFFFFNFIILVICIFIILVETNRAPFDFREGERELISGFNTEYGSLGFVFFILSEYTIIIFFSFFFSIILNIKVFFFLLFIFLIRRTRFPRFRYDFLINFMWFKKLPFICIFFIFLQNF